MQLDNSYLLGSDGILFINTTMKECFGNSIKLIEEDCDLKHHGWFTIKYEYLPQQYFILIEGEFNSFNVRLTNKNGGFIALKQLIDYNGNLLKNDILYTVHKMKEKLKSPIDFNKRIED